MAWCTNDLINGIKGEFDLPTIVYTPYAIFSNSIPIFDINFFNPAEDKFEKDMTYVDNRSITQRIISEDSKELSSETYSTDKQKNNIITNLKNSYGYSADRAVNLEELKTKLTSEDFAQNSNISVTITTAGTSKLESAWYNSNETKTYTIISSEQTTFITNWDPIYGTSMSVPVKTKRIYLYELNVENLSDVLADRTKGITYQSSSKILAKPVAGIYKTLRNMAVVCLLSILVYVGIRMVLTSVSKEKAKYRKMLIDWFIALVLVFVLHYLMAFIVNISIQLTNLTNKSSVENVMLQIPTGTKIVNYAGETEKLDESNKNNFWSTNFMGVTRFYAGLVQNKGYTVKGITYTLMYVVMVIYMVIFTFQYIKRVLYMAFLTMIAPLVAITYPLDKISDGRAQGFSLWLKEYIFNALLQPIHCLIYVVVIGSVMQLVVDFPIYGLVALGFMVPAEKFIRKLFGFEKASTVGSFGAAAGAAALMGAVQKLSHRSHGNKTEKDMEKANKDRSNRGIKTIDSIPSVNGEKVENPPSKNDSTQKWISEYWDKNSKGQYFNPYTEEWQSASELEAGSGSNNNSTDSSNENGDSTNENLVTEGYNSSTSLSQLDNISDNNSKFSIINGARSMVGHYGRRLHSGVKKIHPIRSLRRGLTYGVGAAALGGIGLAAGIASGDPSKALQYTMTGGIAGGKLGRNVGETASNAIGIKDGVRAFTTGALGENAKKLSKEKHKQDFKNNVSNYDRAIKRVNNNGWKEMSKNGGVIDTALDYGISEIDIMCNIYKTQRKLINKGMGEEEAKDSAFRAYKLSSEFGDYSTNSKTQENIDKILGTKGYSKEVKEKTKKEIFDLMKTYKESSIS